MVKAVDKENEHESKLYAIKKFWRWGIRKEHKEALFQEVIDCGSDVSRSHER